MSGTAMTEFKIAGRGGGKTYALLRAASILPDPTQCMIVTHSDTEASRIRRMYQELYPESAAPRFAVPESAAHIRRGLAGPVFVDNVDIILANMFGYTIDYATANGHVTR